MVRKRDRLQYQVDVWPYESYDSAAYANSALSRVLHMIITFLLRAMPKDVNEFVITGNRTGELYSKQTLYCELVMTYSKEDGPTRSVTLSDQTKNVYMTTVTKIVSADNVPCVSVDCIVSD